MQNVLTFQVSGRNHFISNEAATELSPHQTRGLRPLLEEKPSSKETEAGAPGWALTSVPVEKIQAQEVQIQSKGLAQKGAFLFGWFIYFASSANLEFV